MCIFERYIKTEMTLSLSLQAQFPFLCCAHKCARLFTFIELSKLTQVRPFRSVFSDPKAKTLRARSTQVRSTVRLHRDGGTERYTMTGGGSGQGNHQSNNTTQKNDCNNSTGLWS